MRNTNEGLYDEQKVRQTIKTIFAPGMVFEVRIIRNGRKGGISGYFKSADDLLKAFDLVDLRNANVYMTINNIDESCFDMAQQNRFIEGASTTQDTDVKNYEWLFIDLDPKRKSGLSSTDEQREAAFQLARRVANYLQNHNFTEPIKAVSGNGAHLLYPVALKNNAENEKLIRQCLKALDLMFSTDEVDVDISTFNPARICKLYGTMAQKGANSAKRPHRMSYIFSVPDERKVTPKANLEWLASQLPEEEPTHYSPSQYSHEEFNIEHWLSEHGLQYTVKSWRDGATKYVLEECPFNHDHKAPDSCVIKQSSGAIGFKCLHNSCQDKTWKDLRLMFEPDAYDKADRIDYEIELGWRQHSKAKQAAETKSESKEAFFNMETILNRKEPESEYLSTGIDEIDYTMKGLQKGCVSVLSGLRGAAKSTFLSQLMLSMINNGKTVVCYSGELSSKNFAKWILLQAAGKKHVKPLTKFQNAWVVESDETKMRIAKWMGEQFWLFDNDIGNNAYMVVSALSNQAKKVKADFIVVDNLMALDLGNDSEKYEAQTNFVWALKHLAKECDAHVLFVAHPRKTSLFLRLNDISGSANIGNIVDDAFIIHRKNNDFDKAFAEYFGKKRIEIPDTCTNVIEVCKDRENGTQDLFVPLWYEANTKRLLAKTNEKDYVHYKWETQAAEEIPLDEAVDDNDNPF